MAIRSQGTGQGTQAVGQNTIPSYLWAARPSASQFNGAIIRITDVGGGNPTGGGGNYFFSNGTRWKPLNGSIILDAVDTANSSIANTAEQNLNPTHDPIPAGVLGDFDRLRLRMSWSKVGTVGNTTIRVRYGPLGTTADPLLVGITDLSGTSISGGYFIDFKRASATTLQKLGNGNTVQSYTGASAVAYPAPVVVSSMDANIMFLSISSQNDASEIVTLQDYTLEDFATDSQ